MCGGHFVLRERQLILCEGHFALHGRQLLLNDGELAMTEGKFVRNGVK